VILKKIKLFASPFTLGIFVSIEMSSKHWF